MSKFHFKQVMVIGAGGAGCYFGGKRVHDTAREISCVTLVNYLGKKLEIEVFTGVITWRDTCAGFT